ncbi:hypothetical protein HDV00_008127 [Rhizophlyctis rosea]|nr:hypothetical protein HDV00_008127 [Rhizophlyctis rosea]
MYLSSENLVSVLLLGLGWVGCADAWAAKGKLADHWASNATVEARFRLLPRGWSFERGTTWADEVKHRPRYSWSYATHFVDGTIAPPCSFDPPSSYETGINSLTAIANHTAKLVSRYRLSAKRNTPIPNDRQTYSSDLLFLIHHIGDIAQPLHAYGKARGGNDVLVRWQGQTHTSLDIASLFSSSFEEVVSSLLQYRWNLHFIWDDAILTRDIRENFGGSVEKYYGFLVKETENGQWTEKREEWTRCIGDGPKHLDAEGVYKWGMGCAIDWANDSTQHNCALIWDPMYLGVLPATPDLPNGKWNATAIDLSGVYYDKGKEIVREQIAKAGWRMAKYLDAVFDRSGAPPKGVVHNQAPLHVQLPL